MENLSRSLPPLRAMLAFEAAARRGSFTNAARELNVSQPAVSRQVRALEEALGVALFHRDHRRVTLTDAGEVYYGAVASAFGRILAAGQSIAQSAATDRVTIYANYGLASYWLMPRLSRFQEAHPEVEIAVRTVEEEQNLSETEPEIAIRFGQGQWRDGTARPLFFETGFPVCSPSYLETAPVLASVEDLRHHRLLQVKTETQPWLDWVGFLKYFEIDNPPDSGPSYNNYTLAIQAALAGEGVAIGWDQIVDDFLHRGWLIRPITAQITTDFGYYSVTNHMAQTSEGLEKVLNWLHQ